MLCIPETASQASYTATGLAQCSGATLFKGREKENFKGLWSAGKNLRLPDSLCFLFPSRQRQAPIKFFGVEGEREGEAAPFVHKRGASPSHKSYPPLLRAIQHAQGDGHGHMGGSDGVLAL